MFKRVGAIVVTIAMLLSMACTFSLASAADNMALEVLVEDNVQAVNPGDKVTIEVNVVNQTAALCGITVLGKFDTTKWDIEEADISAVDLSPLTFVPVLDKSAEAEANISAVWMGWPEILPAQEYNILRLTFTAKEEADLGDSTFSFWFKEDGMVNAADNFTGFSTETVTASVAVADVVPVTLAASVVGDPAFIKAGDNVTVQVSVKNYAGNWAGMTIEGSYDKNLVSLSAEGVNAIGLGANAPVLVLDDGRVAVTWMNAENMAGEAEFVALTLTFTALEDISGNAIFNFSFKDGGVISIGANGSYNALVAGSAYVKDAPALNVEIKDVVPMFPTVTAQADAVKQGETVNFIVSAGDYAGNLWGISFEGTFDAAKFTAAIEPVAADGVTATPVVDNVNGTYAVVFISTDVIANAPGFIVKLTAKDDAALGDAALTAKFKADGMVGVGYAPAPAEEYVSTPAEDVVEIQRGFVPMAAVFASGADFVKQGEVVEFGAYAENYLGNLWAITYEGTFDAAKFEAEIVANPAAGVTVIPVVDNTNGTYAVVFISANAIAASPSFTLKLTAKTDAVLGDANVTVGLKADGMIGENYVAMPQEEFSADKDELTVEVKSGFQPVAPTINASAESVKQGETVDVTVGTENYLGNLWAITYEGTFDAAKFEAEIVANPAVGVTAIPVVDNANGTYAVAFISANAIAEAPSFTLKLTAKTDAALGDAGVTVGFKADGMIGEGYAAMPEAEFSAEDVDATINVELGVQILTPYANINASEVKQGETVDVTIGALKYAGNLWSIAYEGTFDAAKFSAEVVATPAAGVTAVPVVDNTNGTYAVVFLSANAIAEAPSFVLKLTAKTDAALGDATITAGFKADGMIGENYVQLPAGDYTAVAPDVTVEVTEGVPAGCDHEYTGEWLKDDEGHWKECDHCEEPTAKIPHSGEDDGDCTTAVVCECGHEITPANADHTLGEWQKDDEGHWKECDNCDYATDKVGHSGEDDGDCTTAVVCECGHEITPANADHTLGEWQKDDAGHWKECDNCDYATNKVGHSGEDDGDCTTAVVCECGYVITPANADHTLGEWQKDDEGHWKECDNCDYATNKVGHSGEDDGDCTTAVLCECGHEITPANADHTLGEWQKDDEGHWKECDNCDYATNKVGHSGEDDGDCTTAVVCECGYEIIAANPSHTGNGEWAWNDEVHWQACVNCGMPTDEVEHTHVADPFDCTMPWVCECSHEIEGNLDHDFENGEWDYDGFGHWKVCADCECTGDKYDHVEPEDDFDCTTALICECGYVFTPANDSHDFSAMPYHDGVEGAEAGHYYYCSRSGCWGEEYEPCSFTATVVPETCIEDGYTAYRCTKCHYGYIDNIVPAHGNHTGIVLQYKAPSSDANGAQGIVVKYCSGGHHVLEEIKDVPAGHPFPDVQNPNEWYYDAAVFCKAFNIMKGDENGNMNFANPITRGELVTALGRIIAPDVETNMSAAEFEAYLAAQGSRVTGMTSGSNLTDVAGTFYERYAKLFAKWGIVTGYEDGSFRGNNNITREEMATLLYRFTEAYCGTTNVSFGAPAAGFNDASTISAWAVPYANWAGQVGLFRGDENGNFNPKNNASRAEIAMVCYRMLPVLMNIQFI